MAKILVTGSSGHLGANLVRRLLCDGRAVKVLVRPQSGSESLAGLDVERVEGDLRDPGACRRAVAECHEVHHCAAMVSTIEGNARHKRLLFESNVLGTRNLLRAAREAEIRKVVVTGSLSAVGHTPSRPCTEEVVFNPFEAVLPYGLTKAGVEHECLKAFAEGLPVVVAVACAILGPNDFKPSRMGQTLVDFANRKLWAYVPGGFEFVSASDMVQGHLLCMEKGRPGQRYIFSTQFLTVDELMAIFEEITRQPQPRLRLPGVLMQVVASAMDVVLHLFPNVPRRFTPGAVRLLRMRRRADCSKARRELGYQPTSIREAIREAYEFFLRRGLIKLPSERQVGAASEPRISIEQPLDLTS
jgi:nucleoside-diphosphate-sugar epimerase